MSRTPPTREEAINQLFATIKTKFEQDGLLQEVRCLLQAKMVAMMMGKGEASSLAQRPNTSSSASTSADNSSDTCMELLHQLIMEYFHWRGFHYSAQMFSLESSSVNATPMRQCLEAVLGQFEHKSLPILLQLVAQQNAKHQPNTNDKPKP